MVSGVKWAFVCVCFSVIAAGAVRAPAAAISGPNPAPDAGAFPSVSAEVEDPFVVFDERYGPAGTAGNYTVEIHGAAFDRTVTATLQDVVTGLEHEAAQYYRSGPGTLYATFDLTVAALGVYDVVIEKVTTGETATVYAGLTVIEGDSGTSKPRLENVPPSIVRDANEFYFFDVVWENTGINDALSPIIEVKSNEPLGDDPNDLLAGGGRYRQVFYGLPEGGGPPGILRPGQSGMRTFVLNPQPLPDGQDRDITYSVNRLYQDPNALFDWDAIRDDIKPLDMAEERFELIFENLKIQVGETCGAFLERLSHHVNLLPWEQLRFDSAWQDGVSLQFLLAEAALGSSIAGQLVNPEFECPIANVAIVAFSPAGGSVYPATTLADGSFVLIVDPNSYRFTGINVVIGQSDPVVVNPGEPTEIVLPVAAGGELIGRVLTSSGEPAADVEVLLSGVAATTTFYRVARTDDNGEFVLSHVPEGTYSVGIEPTETGWSQGQSVTVTDNTTSSVVLPLEATCLCEIRVVQEASGGPVEEAVVVLEASDMEMSLRGYTDEEGLLKRYAPPGLYAYEVRAETLVSSSGMVSISDSGQSVLVSLGTYGSLMGTVAQEICSQAEGIIVTDTADGAYDLAALEGCVYEFPELEPGSYDIFVAGADSILAHGSAHVYSGQETQAPIPAQGVLDQSPGPISPQAGMVHSLSVSAGSPSQIPLGKALRLLHDLDQIIDGARLAVGFSPEVLGDPPSELFGYPDLGIEPYNELWSEFYQLCDDREEFRKKNIRLLRLWSQQAKIVQKHLPVLLTYQGRSTVVAWIAHLGAAAGKYPNPYAVALGNFVWAIAEFVNVYQLLDCVGALDRVDRARMELYRITGEINEQNVPYNEQLKVYESKAEEERSLVREEAQEIIDLRLAVNGGVELEATRPGTWNLETRIPLGAVGVLVVAQGGGPTKYLLCDVGVTVRSAGDSHYVNHAITVYDAGDVCRKVGHPYRLMVTQVEKCTYGHETDEWSVDQFLGPQVGASISIELCREGPPEPGEGDDSRRSRDGTRGACDQMRALFCDALAEFAAAGREINAMLEAGLFWEAMAKSQEATVTVNATIATLTELWKEQCMEETGLSVDAIIRECPDGGAFLDISYDD